MHDGHLNCDGSQENLNFKWSFLVCTRIRIRYSPHLKTPAVTRGRPLSPSSKFVVGYFQSVVTEICGQETQENVNLNQTRRGPLWKTSADDDRQTLCWIMCVETAPVLLLHSLSLTLSVSWAKNSMISSSWCSTMVSHCRRGDEAQRLIMRIILNRRASRAFGVPAALKRRTHREL